MVPVIYTFTGRKINPLDVDPADLDIRDIAHGLALINRFNGHTKGPISVAQHSVYAAILVDEPYKLQALLHDAAEAYLGDVTKWLKQSPEMKAYREAEEELQNRIFERFGCPTEQHVWVSSVDRLLVRYEGQKGFGEGWHVADMRRDQAVSYPELTREEIDLVDRKCGPWSFWSWQRAEREFLQLYWMLTSDGNASPIQPTPWGDQYDAAT